MVLITPEENRVSAKGEGWKAGEEVWQEICPKCHKSTFKRYGWGTTAKGNFGLNQDPEVLG